MSDPVALRRSPAAERIRSARLVVVLRRIEPPERLLALVDELADAGARVFEITFDAPDAAAALRACRARLAARADGPHAVGAGTILDRGTLEAARAAGAEFAVSPAHDPAVLAASLEAGIPFVPGCFTPSEALHAWRAGATFVKLFPASALGPAFVRELRAPLPELEVIPTGGVEAAGVAAFLAAGAVAVGVGSAFVRGDAPTRAGIVRAALGGTEGGRGAA